MLLQVCPALAPCSQPWPSSLALALARVAQWRHTLTLLPLLPVCYTFHLTAIASCMLCFPCRLIGHRSLTRNGLHKPLACHCCHLSTALATKLVSAAPALAYATDHRVLSRVVTSAARATHHTLSVTSTRLSSASQTSPFTSSAHTRLLRLPAHRRHLHQCHPPRRTPRTIYHSHPRRRSHLSRPTHRHRRRPALHPS